jgi:hypothetical protein
MRLAMLFDRHLQQERHNFHTRHNRGLSPLGWL